MNIINVFELTGMPGTADEQNALVNSTFKHSYVHIKNDDTGQYLLVRINAIDESKFETIRKLDPNDDHDAEVMGAVVVYLTEQGLMP